MIEIATSTAAGPFSLLSPAKVAPRGNFHLSPRKFLVAAFLDYYSPRGPARPLLATPVSSLLPSKGVILA